MNGEIMMNVSVLKSDLLDFDLITRMWIIANNL